MTGNGKLTKVYRFLVMGILLLGCVGLAYYFHIVHGITVGYTHLFYIPIVAAAFWWGLKAGLPVSLFLALTHTALSFPDIEGSVLSRSLVLVFVGSVIGIISDMRRRAEEALRRSRRDFGEIFQAIGQPLMILDPQHRIMSVNRVTVEVSDRSEEELTGMKCFELFHGTDKPPEGCPLEKMRITGQLETVVMEVEALNRSFLVSCTPMLDDSGRLEQVIHIATDMTGLRQAEEKIKHLNLVLRAIRNVNQLVVTERDRARLIQHACENLTETRGYCSAWIVLLDETGRYVMSAEAGLGEDFLPMLEMLKRGEFTLCGRNALSKAGVVVTENPASACADCPLSEKYAGRSAMTICLEHGGKIYGLLSVSIPADFIPNEEEQGLFKEVAGDIAFALHGIEMEAERELMVEALQESEEKYRSVFENTGTATVTLEEDFTISMANTQFEELSGYSREELEGRKKWTEFIVGEDLERMKGYATERRKNGGKAPTEYTFRFADREGNIKDIFIRVGMIPGTEESIASLMDITPLKRAEESLRQSEEQYRGFFEASKDTVYITSVGGKVLDINGSGLELFGIKRDDLDKINIAGDIYADPADRAALMEIVARKGYAKSHEVNFKRMDGTVFPATITAATTKDAEGNITGYQGIIRDETDRKLAEDRIRQSLREKEILLAEIHHRVKNNMQIVTSLLSLQSRDIEDERARSLVRNCEDRIGSMSLVHERLYLSKDLSRVDFSDYITSMATRLFQVHRVDSRVVSFSSHIKDVLFTIETAIPLGLILNELISNALKHGFPGGRKGEITIALKKNKRTGKTTLTVADNGVGFPEGVDYRNPETFGLQLVEMLTEQLNGTVELDRSGGTAFRITFKEQVYRGRI